ncbi:interleukin-17 receptor C [Xyrichtys novacula]|uniref:Interleukin-17 receptor C n=1 Tax=Xyrichtys novacula TaxID=13765 RepID=A0AAV1HG83_XYRNO|nr:interleukin-17 receptor C [Xyrichtys novacula]
MSSMRLCTAGVVIAIAVFTQLLECTTTCQVSYVDGDCPVKLTSAPNISRGRYTEHVTVSVWKKAWDSSKDPNINIISPENCIIYREKKKKKKKVRCAKNNLRQVRVRRASSVSQQSAQNFTPVYKTDIDMDDIDQAGGTSVCVKYSSPSRNCTVSCTIPDFIPEFNVSVNQSSKSFNVTVGPGHKVHARWCYSINLNSCINGRSSQITIDPSQSQSGLLKIPYLLPCSCVEVYYTHLDPKRDMKCPLLGKNLDDVSDVWLSSKLTPYKSYLQWSSKCPASFFQISASLCWRQHEHVCTPVFNFSLPESKDGNLRYNISAVDKHPQMCVQLSVQGSHNISCLFKSDESSWEVYTEAGKQSVYLYFTSTAQVQFSAQFCVLHEGGCTPIGQVHNATMEANSTQTVTHVPLLYPDEKPCVQVWQSHPALIGRRILCPYYTHNRWGVCAFAALIVVVFTVMLGIFVQRVTKKGAAGWLSIHKPVLLVCSSEQAAHISAVCALASILQGELSATVHMALWAQNSQKEAGAGTGVADLGPLPWLYGQWEAVRKAQGQVLIVWGPEAKKSYDTWREARAAKRQEGQGQDRRLDKHKDERDIGKEDCSKPCDDKDCYSMKEPSTVIAPVFTAALACLERELQGSKGQGLALVYFQGLCHRGDIPKTFREVPRYCLPKDFRGFIQELGGMSRQMKKDMWHCWPRLLSKILSIWQAQRLAQRLRTVLLQTQGKKTQEQSARSSQKMKSNKTRGRLKLPVEADIASSGTVQEHEPLHVSPWRAEVL